MAYFKHTWRVVFLLTVFSVAVKATPVVAADLVVSAAASLTNAFKELGEDFTKQHADTPVLTSFAASDVLAQQIVNGAPVDVFASADQSAMDKAVAAGVIDAATRANFVQNKVVLIVPIDNPKHIQSVADLARPEVLRVAYGNPSTVPVGRYTQSALEQMGQWGAVESRKILGQNVRQVLDYVSRGEVDAGFVFATDAQIMPDKVLVIQQLSTTQPVNYPIALVQRADPNPKAQAYVDYILSESGQAILAKYGFVSP